MSLIFIWPDTVPDTVSDTVLIQFFKTVYSKSFAALPSSKLFKSTTTPRVFLLFSYYYNSSMLDVDSVCENTTKISKN